jgi:hypothetical protein
LRDLRGTNLEAVDLREAEQQTAKLMGPLVENAGRRFILEDEFNVHTDLEWLQEVFLVFSAMPSSTLAGAGTTVARERY